MDKDTRRRLAELKHQKQDIEDAKVAYREEFGLTDGEKLEVARGALADLKSTLSGQPKNLVTDVLEKIQ